ncbi:hypothetical protein MCOR02_006016 [Pyricularia oryzae]|uniref:Methyltransferase domain-containing protein n=1 Tax=Pyricularia oryzae TaxID=318829 RepID=A0A4V1C792_PYROR|nr:hypothetical protein MCOR02_006016 [Pyricularia oryzae]KAI6498004.1 hypothetical protein MCOR13_006620 [Pyricularia oryzae]QBZ62578.1 hypothetical protein PoMZ_11461 [Pyricularia oryzae]
MTGTTQDNWSSNEYQNAASFVPKLAVEIMRWLDPQKDDVILDIGCGDGVLDLQIAQIMAQGRGSLHGIDSSASMIGTAVETASNAGLKNCTFEACDATDLVNKPELQAGTFTKVFSNAAMHWILRPEDKRKQFFVGVKNALVPGGTFAFEMGGLGNVSELKAGILSAVGRRIGLHRAAETSPWFFPDEDWTRKMMEKTVGGWKIERIERVWRPTTADAGGVDAWIRLMAKQFFDALPAHQREECIREVVGVLEKVCAKPEGGYMFSYVRLRVLARKL